MPYWELTQATSAGEFPRDDCGRSVVVVDATPMSVSHSIVSFTLYRLVAKQRFR